MNELLSDGTSVLMAVVGVALMAVIVSQRSNTASVVKSLSGGFSSILGTAMGGASGASGIGMTY